MRGTENEGPDSSSRSFGLHVLDNLFRHRVLFVLPLLLFSAVGFYQTQSDFPEYESTAIVRIGANPNVGTQLVRGTNIQFRESASEGTIRLIKEQFSTRQFATDVTERAGLGAEIPAGWGVLEAVRSNIDLTSEGDTLLAITATWQDPQTSFALVEATIGSYAGYLAETATTDAAQAEQFYRTVLTEAQDALAAREAELTDYVSTLAPIDPDTGRSIAETVEITRREGRVERAITNVNVAQQQVDSAIVANTLATADSARALVIEDAPRLPAGPVSTTSRDLKTIIGYVVMGLVVSSAALLVTSSVDKGFSIAAEVAAVPGVEAVALAPPVKRSLTDILTRGKRRSKPGDPTPDDIGLLVTQAGS